MDRSQYPVVKKTLAQARVEKQERISDPVRAVEMVWEISRMAYAMSGVKVEQRLQRNVVRLSKRGG